MIYFGYKIIINILGEHKYKGVKKCRYKNIRCTKMFLCLVFSLDTNLPAVSLTNLKVLNKRKKKYISLILTK